MAADQALSFDVITADGNYVTANAKSNADLFWALKGGGPSTFGIVTSVTVKTFPETIAAGTIIDINSTHTTDSELFWKAVEAFHELSNLYVDNGMFVYYELMELRLHIKPFVAPNMDAKKLKATLKPLFDRLDALAVPYDTSTKEFNTFFDLYTDLFDDEDAGGNVQIGGRFFTKRDIAEFSKEQVAAMRVAANPRVWS